MKSLIHEIHRRSLWQVLGIYLAGSWVALQVVEQLTEAAGLPDWVRPFSLVLLILGFPIVMATAFVQEGLQTREPEAPKQSLADAGEVPPPPVPEVETHRKVLTWRNAVLGGVGAAVFLGLTVGAYFLMRVTGVGPAASLVAQGVLEAGEPVILAEFANTSDDASLGGVVTEALRVDLSSGTAMMLLPTSLVREALGRMGREADEPLTADLAYEVAVRDGIKAVVEGEVGSAGSGYILVARIGPAGGGPPLATFRRTAAGPDEIISAIDGLSQDIREKAGESLRSIRAEEPLEAVTTRSLAALERYVAGEALDEQGDHIGAKALLEEAVEIDPEFAMAWRKLAVMVSDAGGTREEEIAAATRAYELRHRLTERERQLAAAYYHDVVTGDLAESERAYRAVLERHPDDPTALNNLSLVFAGRLRFEESIPLLRRAISGAGSSSSAFTNLALFQAWSGETEEARATLEMHPLRGNVWWYMQRFSVESVAGEWDAAHAMGDSLVTLPEAPEEWRSLGRTLPALVDLARGRLEEALEHFDSDVRAARAAGRPHDALLALVDASRAERLAGVPGEAPARLRRAVALLDSVAATEPNYGSLALELARSGFVEEAGGVMDRWEAAGALATSAPVHVFDDVSGDIEAIVVEDPAARADAIRARRTMNGCSHCLASDMGDALEEAGDLEGAIDEYERAWSLSEGNHLWFAARRVLLHERLARLYDALGNAPMASDHYQAFVAVWEGADADLQPRVAAARNRLAELAEASQ